MLGSQIHDFCLRRTGSSLEQPAFLLVRPIFLLVRSVFLLRVVLPLLRVVNVPRTLK